MNLLQTGIALFNQDHRLLGIIVGAVFFVLPGIYLIGLLLVTTAAGTNKLPWIRSAFARSIFHLQEWSMPDVFLVGALISLIKISSMARVEFGFSFWSFVLFVIAFITTLGSIDQRRIIQELETHE